MSMKLFFQVVSFTWLVLLLSPSFTAAAASVARPNCRTSCSSTSNNSTSNGVSIPYPFGIGAGCYYDESFEITCVNSTTNDSIPYLRKFDMEVLDVELAPQQILLNLPIASCAENSWDSIDLRGSPFLFSDTNKFKVLGCDNALLLNQTSSNATLAGCTSTCRNDTNELGGSACFGINCCQTSIPSSLSYYKVNASSNSEINCSTIAFLVDTNRSSSYSVMSSVQALGRVPVLINWRLEALGDVQEGNHREYSCLRSPQEPNYVCDCLFPYEGNPYIRDGCTVIPECASCKGTCQAMQGGSYFCKRSRETEIIIGSTLGGGILFLLLVGGCFLLYKFIKRRREIKLKQEYFKRNGGFLLQQQLSSGDGSVDKTKVFTVKELQIATDYFNVNRILGQGGQGTVYKGMLVDGRIVAVKMSKKMEESQIEQFINEVVILSQIDHRNVVKLLGCCLETEVPLLVYEFISNGNLMQFIHNQDEDFPLTWEVRLRIATEVAGALAYLHSSSSRPIYHRDIKSSNILLDEKYRAKIADFGTSRSIAVDQTHLTTNVMGTFGYLDPEYFRSSHFTDKSDVYSFGVVLVELLTGLRPIISIQGQDDKNLAAHFVSSLEESRLFDILDDRVTKEGKKEEIEAIAKLARRCLNLTGKQRPTMKEVMLELEGIRMSQMPPVSVQTSQNAQYVVEMRELAADDDTYPTMSSSSDFSGSLYIDTIPLMLARKKK